ncbi:hypothetical protein BaRGS_00025175, partial [Batillaria attramentaria]
MTPDRYRLNLRPAEGSERSRPISVAAPAKPQLSPKIRPLEDCAAVESDTVSHTEISPLLTQNPDWASATLALRLFLTTQSTSVERSVSADWLEFSRSWRGAGINTVCTSGGQQTTATTLARGARKGAPPFNRVPAAGAPESSYIFQLLHRQKAEGAVKFRPILGDVSSTYAQYG